VPAQQQRWFVHEPDGGADTLAGILLILWHGAGGDVSEASLLATARAFASHGATAVRARFAYRLAGKRAPDRMPKLIDDARDTIATLRREVAPGARTLILGGRSMGGRAASMLAAASDAVDGLIFLAYPLHPAGKPASLRDEHLYSIRCPMLFIQGDRDALCDVALLRPVLERLGERATLSLWPGADHGMKKVDPAELANAAVGWATRVPR
jgi:predicted alpha/beta-hydrolase family hydrolase